MFFDFTWKNFVPGIGGEACAPQPPFLYSPDVYIYIYIYIKYIYIYMYVHICVYIFCTFVYLYLIVYNWLKNRHFNIVLIYFELGKHVCIFLHSFILWQTDTYLFTNFFYFFYFFFNWDSLHARLNNHYEAWSCKKRSTKKITGYRKPV